MSFKTGSHRYSIDGNAPSPRHLLRIAFPQQGYGTTYFGGLTYTYFTTIPLILNITPAGTNMVLGWTNSASDYALQYTHDLTGGTWNLVTNTSVMIGNQIVLTNAICTTNTFFRLGRQP